MKEIVPGRVHLLPEHASKSNEEGGVSVAFGVALDLLSCVDGHALPKNVVEHLLLWDLVLGAHVVI